MLPICVEEAEVQGIEVFVEWVGRGTDQDGNKSRLEMAKSAKKRENSVPTVQTK